LTLQEGENATFTCGTQIDSLPIFMFYKIDEQLIWFYQNKKDRASLNDLNNALDLINKYSFSIQNLESLDDFETINPEKYSIERRAHQLDSNKDDKADLETMNLNVFNLEASDRGFYVCIIANSLTSFRLTYAFLNVLNTSSTSSSTNNNIESDLMIVEKQLGSFFGRNKFLLGSLVFVVFALILVTFCICYCYVHCMKLKQMKRHNSKNETSKINIDSKMDSILEKTITSMKKVSNTLKKNSYNN
jgi:hypothetical protein